MRHPQWTFRCRTSSRDRCARSSRAPLPRCCRSGSTRRRGGASLSAGSELSGGARLCSPPTHTHTPTAPSSCCAPLTYAPLPMQSAAQDGAKVARAGATGDGGRGPGPGGGEGGETATQGVGAVPLRRAPSPTGPERPNVWGVRGLLWVHIHTETGAPGDGGSVRPLTPTALSQPPPPVPGTRIPLSERWRQRCNPRSLGWKPLDAAGQGRLVSAAPIGQTGGAPWRRGVAVKR